MLASPDFIFPPHHNLTSPQPPFNIMSDDDSSDLSSVPSEDETDLQLKKKDGILKFFPKMPGPAPAPKVEASPPRPKREPSPPHEYVLADNSDIAVSPPYGSP
jgi:hypothetical protein